jgi:hypothetical protein
VPGAIDTGHIVFPLSLGSLIGVFAGIVTIILVAVLVNQRW